MRLPVLITLLALASIPFTGNLAAQPKVDDPTKKNDRLRQPGFLFLELDCWDPASHIEFFQKVTAFELNRKDGNFVVLRSERGEILLNGVKNPPKDRQTPRIGGLRVEIGLVVADLDRAFAAAQKQSGWKIAAGIQRQSWGVRDFRVYSPEGYYLRITEGPK